MHHRERSNYPPRNRSRSPRSRRYSPPRRYEDRYNEYDSPHDRTNDHRGYRRERWDDRDAWREEPRYDDRYHHEDVGLYFNNEIRYRRPERREDVSAPNINVVLRGLPENYLEQDIEKALVDMGASVDQVTLIKDRETGESRRFAFVKFTSVGHAEQFVSKNFPHIFMDRQRVRVDYSRKEAKQADPAMPNQRPTDTESYVINDGLRDISSALSPLLLVRGLDQLTSGESLLEVFDKCEGLRRILIIRERLTQMSSGFAFVEFWKASDATKALTKLGNQVKIDNATTSLTYGLTDGFLPAYVSSQWTIASTVPGGLCEYRDQNLYCEEVVAEPESTAVHEVINPVPEVTKQVPEAKENQQDDLDAFYADMNSILDDEDNDDSIFSVPKQKD
ncbi:hypothetical protein NQZ79_g3040 [Umbelopsis isabellina]|nr:hypothetical protein NQZ79_g3040 [Umbelopsis isabellina]